MVIRIFQGFARAWHTAPARWWTASFMVGGLILGLSTIGRPLWNGMAQTPGQTHQLLFLILTLTLISAVWGLLLGATRQRSRSLWWKIGSAGTVAAGSSLLLPSAAAVCAATCGIPIVVGTGTMISAAAALALAAWIPILWWASLAVLLGLSLRGFYRLGISPTRPD